MNEEKYIENTNPTSQRSKTAHQRDVTLSLSPYELDAFLYAGFGRRFLSYVIDIMVLWAVKQMLLKPLFALTGMDEWQLWISYFNMANMIEALFYFLYFVLMTRFFQQTLGKIIMGIKVYTKQIKTLSWADVLMREWIGRIISNVMLGLPYLAVIFTPKHIGVHDYFADTVVVRQKYLKQIIENRTEMDAYSKQSRYNEKETYI
ncbi:MULTISPECIES: RDD family protein [unclassified Staphylococcus]|uniref:RDD family protein n=1 Tax=unclassified Staphylococcus TaxID=91994 RepID=UPI0021CEE345|nr:MULTISPECIES: RDD family protein [unclassified Staphylococcus]UXR70901.1 RDD family protein [Staphylococcus sp. IVB6240]UXR75427.1 RDD family protein [Staphylococcus sp. IVB6233]UXR79630.1 RDD family protein [Staphylococcus sp. IVB6218]